MLCKLSQILPVLLFCKNYLFNNPIETLSQPSTQSQRRRISCIIRSCLIRHCTLGEIHFSLLSPDEKNTELKKILTKIHLFPLDYFYSNIGTKL